MRRSVLSLVSVVAAIWFALMNTVAVQATGMIGDENNHPTRFAFLPHVFLDFGNSLGYQRAVPSFFVIRNCGDAVMNCFSGGPYVVMWPKKCPVLSVGMEWSARDISAEVASVFTKPVRHGEAQIFVARTDRAKDSLYLLNDDSRLIGLISDPRRREILWDAATDQDFLAELARGTDISEDGYAVSYLVGLGHLSPCES